VFHAQYFAFMERARTELLIAAGFDLARIADTKRLLFLVHGLNARYHQPARLNDLREGWLNPPGLEAEELKTRTLTNLYNERPTWLRDAHARLDRAVLAAYGWPADTTDDDLLERLLALNLERAAEG